MSGIREIGHAVLHVSDLDASTEWYRDVMGMELVQSADAFNARFFSFGRRDHDLALIGTPEVAGHGGREYHHLAFEFEGSLDDFKAFRRRLVERGVTITGTVDHGISYGMYFLDPDGHQLEVFLPRTDPDADAREAFRRTGVRSTPVDVDALEE